MKGQTEGAVVEEKETTEEKTEEQPKEPAPAPEPEDKTMTLEEYRKQKKTTHRNPNAKKEDEQVSFKLKNFSI